MADSRTNTPTTSTQAADVASGRADRGDETRQERRRRVPGSLDRTAHLKLAVPPAVAAANADQHLHWASDKGNRLHFMTVQDDYSKVEGVEPVPVETDAAGKPVYAHLLKKRLDWYEADQREKNAVTDQKESSLMRSPKTSDEDHRSEDVSYVTKGNRISRG